MLTSQQISQLLEWIASAIEFTPLSEEASSVVDYLITIQDRPPIVCLCGSTKHALMDFQRVNYTETLAGKVVLSIGCDTKSDEGLGISAEEKEKLDHLHLQKIDLADEVLVLNKWGYVGESTRREIWYAVEQNKTVLFHEYHTVDCMRETTRTTKEHDEWVSKWPNYCTSCGSTGLVHYPGNFYEPPSDDACPRCLEVGKCPRCGEFEIDVEGDEEEPCRKCGWRYGKNAGDWSPYIYECFCYEALIPDWGMSTPDPLPDGWQKRAAFAIHDQYAASQRRPKMKSAYDGLMVDEL